MVQWNGVWGRFYEGDEKGVWFDSSKPHAVEEAVGDRIVIVAYTPRGIFKGAKQDVALLQELGFKIPSGNTNHPMTSVVGTQFGKEPQYFDISSDSEEGSFEGEWGSTGEPKNQDQRVERMVQLVREERKALDEELQLGAVCMTPALLAELQEDLRIAELLQEHDECERDVELGCSRLALHRLASVELALEDAWKSVEKTSMPQVRAMRRPVGSNEARGVPSLQPVEAPVEEAVDHDRELVEPVVRGLRDGVELDLCSGLVQGESAGESHPSFGEETPELTAKGALPTPGALLQTRIVPQSEIWDNLEAWRQPLTDEVTALKNVHQAVWPIGPEELKKLEALAQVSVIPAKGVYTQKPISGRLRARIVGCGNYLEAEPPESDGLRGKVRTQDLYAGGVDGVTIRLQTSMAAVQGWASAGLDIKTAFLGAPLYQDQQGQAVLTPGDLNSNSLDFDLLIKKLRAVQGERVKIVVVNPPKILVRLGLIEESEKWLVIKALYGLAEAPRRWSAHRDLLLRKISWEEGERKYFLVQCVADHNLWRIVSRRQPESAEADSGLGLHGLLGVYVDDMLITAETAIQTRLIQELRAVWNTSEPEFAEVGRPIRFCGFNLHRLTGGGYLLNQEDYVQDLLQRFSDIQGTSEVPCLKEEEIEPEEPCPKQLKRAQMLTGALQWITTRTRPDICFAVNKTAQLMSKFPAYATRYAENIIRYLRSTPGLGLVFKPLDEQCRFGKSEELTAPRAAGLLEVFADASFGPTSNKSHTGIVAVFCGAVVAWASHRQSTTAQSSAEAELYSSLDGVLMLEVLESLAREISSVTLRKILYTDSLGCLSLFTAPAGAWRTRHLRLKARAGREKLENQVFEMRHLSGRYMLADVATKSLPGQRHRELLQLLEMCAPRDCGDVVGVRKVWNEGLNLSSRLGSSKGSGIAMGVKTLILAVSLLVLAASKVTITIDAHHEGGYGADSLVVIGALLLVVATCVLKQWRRRAMDNDPIEVRSMELTSSHEDEWSVVETTAETRTGLGAQDIAPQSNPEGSGFGSRTIGSQLSRRCTRTHPEEELTSSAQELDDHFPGLRKVGLNTDGPAPVSGVGQRTLTPSASTSGMGERHAPVDDFSGVGEQQAPVDDFSGVGERNAPENEATSGIDVEEVRIHPSWKLPRVPPKAFWPAKPNWGGFQAAFHQPIPVGASRDTWFVDETRGVLVRFHNVSRVQYFDPSRTKLPDSCQASRLTGLRRTFLKYLDSANLPSEIVEDNYRHAEFRKVPGSWVGRTEFQIFRSEKAPSSSQENP